MKKNLGLTLIELVLVLAVISILSAVVALSVLNSERREVQSMSLKLQADMRYAQRMAMVQGRHWKVTFLPNAYIISAYEEKGSSRTVKKVDLPRGLEFSRYSSPDMLYFPRGTASKGFSVYIESGRYYQRLTATVSGGRIAVSEISSY